MLLLKIKRAECALADGRLDEAFDLARLEAVRAHRHGQRLLTALTAKLLERARQHLAESRPRESLADCGKAEQLAGNSADVAQVRAAAQQAIDAAWQAAGRRKQELAAVRQHIDAGNLSFAGAALADLPQDTDAAAARRQLDQRRQLGGRSLDLARAAMEQDALLLAVGHLGDARRRGAPAADVQQLSAELRSRIADAMRAALTAGRLDVAGSLAEAAAEFDGEDLRLIELVDAVTDCRRAAAEVLAGRPDRAAVLLSHVRRAAGDARWLNEAMKQAEALAEHQRALDSGPLGLLKPAVSPQPRRNVPSEQVFAMPEQPIHHDASRFLLHIDGGGSYLVVTGANVSIGPRGGRGGVDVPLLADATMPPITFQRSDEDYFLNSPAMVKVNGRPASRTLLQDGDRIELTTRGRMRFHRPNPASTSAVLSLDGVRITDTDARRVILLDRELVIGPDARCHIRLDHLRQAVMICRRDGQLTIAAPAPAPGNVPHVIVPGKPVKLGGLSLYVTEVSWR